MEFLSQMNQQEMMLFGLVILISFILGLRWCNAYEDHLIVR